MIEFRTPIEQQGSDTILIRITGAMRVLAESNKYATLYSWEAVQTPNQGWTPELGSDGDYTSRPEGISPLYVRGGPRDSTSDSADRDPDGTRFPAIEVSGCDSVPTNGSAVVWATYDGASQSWRFQYAGTTFMKITGTATTDGAFYYEASQVEPYYTGSGWAWRDKDEPHNITSGEEVLASSAVVKKNPLVEITGRTDVAVGEIVSIIQVPIPVGTTAPTGSFFCRSMPMADVTIQATGDDPNVSAIHEVAITGAVGGTLTLTFTDPTEATATTTDIDLSLGTSDIQTIIRATMDRTNAATVSGTDATDFTISFNYPGVWGTEVGATALFSDAPLYFTAPAGTGDIFPATLTRRHCEDGCRYAWTRDTFSASPTLDAQIQGMSEEGTVKPTITTEHTQISDTLDPDIWTIAVVGATGGTFTLTDGSTTPAIAYNANDSTINSSLSGISSTFSVSSTLATSLGVITNTHVFTSSDASTSHSITLDGSLLEPLDHHYPALFRNDPAMGVPVAVWLKKGGGGNPKLITNVSQTGDGTMSPTILSFVPDSVRDGKYKLRFTTSDSWQTLKWNASASDLQTSLSSLLACTVTGTYTGGFTITITADNDPHKLLTAPDESGLWGDLFYVVVWSNGNACTGPFGGIEPSSIDGYVGKVNPSATITQIDTGDSSTHYDTFVLQLNHVVSGTYKAVADGGSPVTTMYNASPSLGGGWTVTANADGTSTIKAPNTTPGHTFVVYTAGLRSGKAARQYLASEDDCAVLISPFPCTPVEVTDT